MNEILEKILGFISPYQEQALHLLNGGMTQVMGVLGQLGLSKEDFLTGLLLFSAEISLFLLIVIGMMHLSHTRNRRKDVVMAKELKAKIKEYLPGRKEKLKAVIADMVPQDEAWAAKSAEEAADYEKGLYSKILKIILRKDMDGAMGISHDVERLGDSYQRIVTHLSEAAVTIADTGSKAGKGGGNAADAEKISELKSIVAKLRKEKQQLQDELEASIKSMDNIVKEYSRIYSDAPNSEGTEHLEKEIAALREKVGIHLGDEGAGEEPEPESAKKAGSSAGQDDLGGDVPDLDIEQNEDLKQLREETGLDKEK